jgi:hypothetical protein
LLNRCGAKSVARGEHWFGAGLHDVVRELCAGRGFASSIYTYNRHDAQPIGVAPQGQIRARKGSLQFSPRDGENVQSAAPLRLVCFSDGVDNLCRHFHAEIGGDKCNLEFLESRFRHSRGEGHDPRNLVREFLLSLL